jgi:protein phosphatase
MGGHEAGALASATVVAALASIGMPASAPDLLARLEHRIVRANAQLQSFAQQRGATVGTTVAALLIYDSNYACLWSGDSRIYLVRGQAIRQLSRDHTEVQEMIDSGLLNAAEARHWPRRNVVTRALGVQNIPELDIEQGMLEPNDTFILCSDGLTTHVEDAEILARVSGAAPQATCDSLVALALDRGGTDNVTVVAVRYWPGSPTIVQGARPGPYGTAP